jgi:hypothetical protein
VFALKKTGFDVRIGPAEERRLQPNAAKFRYSRMVLILDRVRLSSAKAGTRRVSTHRSAHRIDADAVRRIRNGRSRIDRSGGSAPMIRSGLRAIGSASLRTGRWLAFQPDSAHKVHTRVQLSHAVCACEYGWS